jgi:lipopolysaccharide biosynthesis protein
VCRRVAHIGFIQRCHCAHEKAKKLSMSEFFYLHTMKNSSNSTPTLISGVWPNRPVTCVLEDEFPFTKSRDKQKIMVPKA